MDAYPGRTFRGTVESLSPATGARFALLPPDNATGNFTKVVQRMSGADRGGRRGSTRSIRSGPACRCVSHDHHPVTSDGHASRCRARPAAALPRGGLPVPLPDRVRGDTGQRARAGRHQHRERRHSPHDGESRRHARRDRVGQHRLHRGQRHRPADHQLASPTGSAGGTTTPARSCSSPSPRSSAATPIPSRSWWVAGAAGHRRRRR